MYNVLQQIRKGLQRFVTSVDLITEECWRTPRQLNKLE